MLLQNNNIATEKQKLVGALEACLAAQQCDGSFRRTSKEHADVKVAFNVLSRILLTLGRSNQTARGPTQCCRCYNLATDLNCHTTRRI